jgi:catechol 2,3-dioxygenase-like lactoylglutathione lyase family enzyme
MKIRIVYLFTILISTPIIGIGQDGYTPQSYFSAIIVKDIKTSSDWYKKVLDLELVNMIDLPERGIKQANLKSPNSWIELIELQDAIDQTKLLKEAGPKAKITGFFKIGFKMEDFDAFVSFIKDHKLETLGEIVTDETTGLRMVILKDPDGNRVQFFEK